MKAPVHGQFRMKGDAEFVAVQHAHDLITKPCHRGAGHGFLLKAWCTNENTWKPIVEQASTGGSHFQRLMVEAISPNRCDLFEVRCWGVKLNLNNGLKGFTLATPSVASDACGEVGRTVLARSCEKNGAGARAQNGPFRMGVHPSKQGREQGLVSARDAHRGGFPTGKNEGIQILGHVVGTTALHDVNVKAEFVSSATKRFSVLVAGALKHRQTHTEHDAGSMPFPISPTLRPR